MFTGIVQAVGCIADVAQRDPERRLRITAPGLPAARLRLGDSIAVNGVCLTVAEAGEGEFVADASLETLRLTTLGTLARGSAVNLEPALTLAEPLGGHLVSGHVDDTGEVRSVERRGESALLAFRVPEALSRYVARKGSVCIDGVSLTVNSVSGRDFSVNLVPHTLERTIMRFYAPGTRVNIEVDLLARYLERLLAAD